MSKNVLDQYNLAKNVLDQFFSRLLFLFRVFNTVVWCETLKVFFLVFQIRGNAS